MKSAVIYAQTPAKSTPQASQPAEVKKTTPTQQEKQEKGEKSDDDKKSDLPLTVVLAILGGVGVLYVGVLWFSPLWLLRLPAELKVPKLGMFPEFKLPLGFVIWLKYRPRVLDAWVEKHIDTFDKKFQENETVDERKDYVSLPVELNKQEIEELTTEDLRKTFEKEKRVRLLIWGEGGSGKTTIACQIAKWAMIKDKSKRLTQHLMLPVLIEQELKLQSGEGMKPLMEVIVGQIQEMSDGEQKIVDELLVEQLLRQRRILLIVDHFSEMSQQTREKINPEVPEFPANALVITSRIEEKFNGIDNKIRILRFDDGKKLVGFINKYLKQRKKWQLFQEDQQEFLEECAQLAGIVGEKKTIIVLLAKLYAERMINAKENPSNRERSLDNIPDLIIDHLKKLYEDEKRRTNEEYHTLEFDAKLIAWKCLERDYKPSYVERKSVIAALSREEADNSLKYFEEKLHLIKSGKSGTIRFALDPLAEYLAGLYLVENYNEKEASWREFFAKVDSNSDKREEIKGFLLAVRDCCLAKGTEAKVPSFVAEELGKLAGLDLEALKQEQQKRRIRRFISNLWLPDKDDRLHAVEELSKMAATAKSAVDGLLIALKDDDSRVRRSAAEALSKLRNPSESLLQELVACIKNDNSDVRYYAAEVLGKLGNPSESVLEGLVTCLKNDNSDVRYYAAEVLGKLGNPSESVLEGLVTCLKDDNFNVRRRAVQALGKLHNASESVLKALLECLLEDDDYDVRYYAAQALGNLGNTSEPVLQALVECMKYDNSNVGLSAAQAVVKIGNAQALGKLGNPSESLLQALVACMKYDNSDVRLSAAQAVVKIGNAQALGKLGNPSESLLQALLGCLKDDNSDVRSNAAWALGELDNTSESVLQGLLGCLKDDNSDVRRSAAWALGK
ncbi:HEAT repeat domain-containing protein, partial [[Scytonema hofmanni] UTEX B 1581]|uniref:HEAT repeat domain-containing protein n=1 Tax=[Scytonema hofmanni] UTEX B 1581 TaxID=379535 RepID=UPI001C8F89E7